MDNVYKCYDEYKTLSCILQVKETVVLFTPNALPIIVVQQCRDTCCCIQHWRWAKEGNLWKLIRNLPAPYLNPVVLCALV